MNHELQRHARIALHDHQPKSLIPINPNTPARCHATVLALPAVRWLFAIARHKKMIMDTDDPVLIMKPAPGFFDHDQLSEETFALRESLSIDEPVSDGNR